MALSALRLKITKAADNSFDLVSLYDAKADIQDSDIKKVLKVTTSSGVLYARIDDDSLISAGQKSMNRITDNNSIKYETCKQGGIKTRNFTFNTSGVFYISNSDLDSTWITPLSLLASSYLIGGGGGGAGGSHGTPGAIFTEGSDGYGGSGGGSGKLFQPSLQSISRQVLASLFKITIGAGGSGGVGAPTTGSPGAGTDGSNTTIEYWNGTTWTLIGTANKGTGGNGSVGGTGGNSGESVNAVLGQHRNGGLGGTAIKEVRSPTTNEILFNYGAGGNGGKGGSGGDAFFGLQNPGNKGSDGLVGYASIDVSYWS